MKQTQDPVSPTSPGHRYQDPWDYGCRKQMIGFGLSYGDRSMSLEASDENLCLHKNMEVNIHSSVIQKSQKVETQMYLSWWTDKSNVV